MLKENKGVTLVALVITIIVLLILAGVSISLVVGDNGVLNQAVNATDETNRATAQSEVEMAISAAQADFMSEWSSNQSMSFKTWVTDSPSRVTHYIANGVALSGTLTVNEVNGTTKTEFTYKGKTYECVIATTASDIGATVTGFAEK